MKYSHTLFCCTEAVFKNKKDFLCAVSSPSLSPPLLPLPRISAAERVCLADEFPSLRAVSAEDILGARLRPCACSAVLVCGRVSLRVMQTLYPYPQHPCIPPPAPLPQTPFAMSIFGMLLCYLFTLCMEANLSVYSKQYPNHLCRWRFECCIDLDV